MIDYDPRTNGEQLDLLGNQLIVTDSAILNNSRADYGVRIAKPDGSVSDIEIFVGPQDSGKDGFLIDVYPLDGRDKPEVVRMPVLDDSAFAIRGMVQAVYVTRAKGQISQNH